MEMDPIQSEIVVLGNAHQQRFEDVSNLLRLVLLDVRKAEALTQ
jgi:hypothetical protein